MSRYDIDHAEERLKNYFSWYARLLTRAFVLFLLFTLLVAVAGTAVVLWLAAGRLSWGQ